MQRRRCRRCCIVHGVSPEASGDPSTGTPSRLDTVTPRTRTDVTLARCRGVGHSSRHLPAHVASDHAGLVTACWRRLAAAVAAARPEVVAQVIVGTVVVAYVASTVLVPTPVSGYSSFWDGWVGNAASILPLVPVAMRVRRSTHLRGAWIAMGIGMAAYNAGNLIYLWHDQNLNPIPSPAPSDAAYLAGYVCFAIGIVMLTQRNYGAVRISTRLDGAITGLAFGSVAGMLWFNSVLQVSGRPLQVVVGMAYPLMDMVLIVVLISALAPMGYRPHAPTALLMLGMAAFAGGDVVYLNQVAADTYVQGTLLDSTWVVGIWLMCLASSVREDRRDRPGRAAGSIPRGFSSVPIVFGSVSVLVLLISLVHHVSRVISSLALAALCLVIVRMALTLREVRRAEVSSFRSARSTSSPALATAARSSRTATNGSPPSRLPDASASSSSTSTASRRSTTPSVTQPATSCCRWCRGDSRTPTPAAAGSSGSVATSLLARSRSPRPPRSSRSGTRWPRWWRAPSTSAA